MAEESPEIEETSSPEDVAPAAAVERVPEDPPPGYDPNNWDRLPPEARREVWEAWDQEDRDQRLIPRALARRAAYAGLYGILWAAFILYFCTGSLVLPLLGIPCAPVSYWVVKNRWGRFEAMMAHCLFGLALAAVTINLFIVLSIPLFGALGAGLAIWAHQGVHLEEE